MLTIISMSFSTVWFAVYFSAAAILDSVLVGVSLGQFLHVALPPSLAVQGRSTELNAGPRSPHSWQSAL